MLAISTKFTIQNLQSFLHKCRMPSLIKNCGLKTPEAVEAAARTGASYVGFVYHEASPRHVDLSDIAILGLHVPTGVRRVIVVTNPSDEQMNEIRMHSLPDFLQVHGVTDPKKLEHIVKYIGVPVITAIAVNSAEDIALASKLEELSAHLLFDAPEPGSGKAFDWTMLGSALKEKPLEKPWFLAGGLTTQNVAEAIRATDAPMVDVSSGLESERGVKSLEKIAEFNKEVLSCQS